MTFAALLITVLMQSQPTPDDLAEAAARAAAAAAGAAGVASEPWSEPPVFQETDLQAVCRQATMIQARLRDIADRETAARHLLTRHINATDAAPGLQQVEEILGDQDDLALAHMIAGWTINRACKSD